MADFVQSFSQGVETGSSLMARAQQLKAQREQLALQQQQEARLQALQPLALHERQLENQLTGMKLAQALQNKAYEVDINKAFLVTGELLQHGDPADPQTSMKILDALIKVPSAHSDPRFKAVMEALNNAQQLKMQKDRLMQQDALTQQRLLQQYDLTQQRFEIAQQGLQLRKDQATDAEGLAKERNELARLNLDMRQQEHGLRILNLSSKLSPVDKAEMDAKLKAVADDLTLIAKPEERVKRIEAISAEFQKRADASSQNRFKWEPGKGLVPISPK